MKTSLKMMLLLLAASGFTACNEDNDISYDGVSKMVFSGNTVDVVSQNSISKSRIVKENGQLNVHFESGDAVSVFDGKSNNIFTAEQGGATSNFIGEAHDVENYYVLYPYQAEATLSGTTVTATLPDVQVARDGSYDPQAVLSVAHAVKNENGFSFSLNNAVSLLKIVTTDNFRKIVVESNGSGYPMAGEVEIAISGNPAAKVKSNGSKSISLVPPAPRTELLPGEYYISLAPGEYSQGIKLTFYLVNGETASLSTGAVTFAASSNVFAGNIGEDKLPIYNLDRSSSPADVAKALGLGWNLGNQLDCPDYETQWGNPRATQELFNALKANGIKTVRIPVSWYGHLGGNYPECSIDDEWLNRVAEVVDYAKVAGLNAIINIHHDGSANGGRCEHWLNINNAKNNSESGYQIEIQIEHLWTQIADKFKNYGNFLIFEGFNEIHNGSWNEGDDTEYKIYNSWVKVFVDAVRNTGGNNLNRWLAVNTFQASPNTACKLELPNDNHLMVSAHYYSPVDYTLKPTFSQWGDRSSDDIFTLEAEDWVKDLLGNLEGFIGQGHPVYIGEVGNVARGTADGEAYRRYYLEYVARVMHEKSMAPILWDNGAEEFGEEKHGYFNHGTGAWINEEFSKPIIQLMLDAVTSDDPNYTSDYIHEHRNPAISGYDVNLTPMKH